MIVYVFSRSCQPVLFNISLWICIFKIFSKAQSLFLSPVQPEASFVPVSVIKNVWEQPRTIIMHRKTMSIKSKQSIMKQGSSTPSTVLPPAWKGHQHSRLVRHLHPGIDWCHNGKYLIAVPLGLGPGGYTCARRLPTYSVSYVHTFISTCTHMNILAHEWDDRIMT